MISIVSPKPAKQIALPTFAADGAPTSKDSSHLEIIVIPILIIIIMDKYDWILSYKIVVSENCWWDFSN